MNPLKIKAASKDPNSAGTADGPDEEDEGGDNDDADGDGDPPPIPHGAAISEEAFFSNDPINGERKSQGRAPVPRSQQLFTDNGRHGKFYDMLQSSTEDVLTG